jgi:hypothetical protein
VTTGEFSVRSRVGPTDLDIREMNNGAHCEFSWGGLNRQFSREVCARNVLESEVGSEAKFQCQAGW